MCIRDRHGGVGHAAPAADRQDEPEAFPGRRRNDRHDGPAAADRHDQGHAGHHPGRVVADQASAAGTTLSLIHI